MKTKRNLIGKRGSLALAVGTIAAPFGCKQETEKIPADFAKKYNIESQVHSFGNLEPLSRERFPVFFHEVYTTSDNNFYIGKLGAGVYAIDADTGQLLNSFAHELEKIEGGIMATHGIIKCRLAPSRYEHFPDWMQDSPGRNWLWEEFEERDGKIYVRDWRGEYGKN